jgi:hypothetical protein
MTENFKRAAASCSHGIVAALLLAAAATASAQAPADTSATDLINRAYDAVGTNPQEARRLLVRATEIEPSNILAWRELGYLDLRLQDFEAALASFEQSERIRPSDTIRLQIGYLYSSLGQEDDAKDAFTAVVQSGDSSISRKASEQLAIIAAGGGASRGWSRFYADPYYDTRWNSMFIHFDFQDGYDLTADRKLSFYGVLSLSTDSRSSSETVPEIISDNALLLGAGLRFKPFYGASAIIQEGVAADLIGGRSSTVYRNDFRAVGYYGNGLYADFKVHDDLRMPLYPFVDMYASFGYYSRFENAIGYLQAKAGARLVEVGHTAFDAYALGDFVWDVEREFYNNIAEGGLGVRLIPCVDVDLHLIVEWRRGTYLDVSDAATLVRAGRYDAYYGGWRFMVVFERTF